MYFTYLKMVNLSILHVFNEESPSRISSSVSEDKVIVISLGLSLEPEKYLPVPINYNIFNKK